MRTLEALLLWQAIYWGIIFALAATFNPEGFVEVTCQILVAFGIASMVTNAAVDS